jgi:uncharacterized protein (DUF2141 family)
MSKIALRVTVATLLVVGSTLSAAAQAAGRLTVSVGNARNDNGSIRCGLYASPDGFGEPGREFRAAVAPIKNGQATCAFRGIPGGQYAVALFHAERNETRMTTGTFGKPQEGYGFSRNPSSTFGAPGFESAVFEYNGGNMNLPVRLNY